MKKECTKYQSMVEQFLEGKLKGFERQGFVEHVKKCKVCHEELEIYHVIYSVVDELNDETAEETTNYMGTLDKKLGTVSKKDAIMTNVPAAYASIVAGIALIVTGVIVFLMY